MAGMTAKEFRELVDFYNIEPFGEYRDELRHGNIMALHANINRDTSKRSDPFEARDFMNYVEREPEKKLTDEEIEAHFDRIFGC